MRRRAWRRGEGAEERGGPYGGARRRSTALSSVLSRGKKKGGTEGEGDYLGRSLPAKKGRRCVVNSARLRPRERGRRRRPKFPSASSAAATDGKGDGDTARRWRGEELGGGNNGGRAEGGFKGGASRLAEVSAGGGKRESRFGAKWRGDRRWRPPALAAERRWSGKGRKRGEKRGAAPLPKRAGARGERGRERALPRGGTRTRGRRGREDGVDG